MKRARLSSPTGITVKIDGKPVIRLARDTTGRMMLKLETSYDDFDLSPWCPVLGKRGTPKARPGQPLLLHGELPWLLTNALPDAWGTETLIHYLTEANGGGEMARATARELTADPLFLLAIVAKDGPGLLDFEPAIGAVGVEHGRAFDPREATDQARKIIAGSHEEIGRNLATSAAEWNDGLAEGKSRAEISASLTQISLGWTVGGAEPKTPMGIRRGADGASPEYLVGASLSHLTRNGFEPWILKFGNISTVQDPSKEVRALIPFRGAIESAYAHMADEAGINFATHDVLRNADDDGRLVTHFLTRRFDRDVTGARLHFISLSAITNRDKKFTQTYAALRDTALQLTEDATVCEEVFRRAAFNLAAANRDDHGKNHGFLLDPKTKVWRLSPAFDVTFSYASRIQATALTETAPGNGGRRIWDERNGKNLAITRAHLLEFAKDSGIRPGRAADILEEVITAIHRWEHHAEKAGVSEHAAAIVAAGMTPQIITETSPQIRVG